MEYHIDIIKSKQSYDGVVNLYAVLEIYNKKINLWSEGVTYVQALNGLNSQIASVLRS